MYAGPYKPTRAQFQVFDGRTFLPTLYLKAVAVEVAQRHVAFNSRPAQVWRKTPAGLVKVLDVTGQS